MRRLNEYSLGIPEIDDQHSALLACFDAIEEAMKQEQSWSSVYFKIAELKELARIHFTCEEALMRLFAFPDIKLHTAEHSHFVKCVAEIEMNSISSSVEKDLVAFLRAWLLKHIDGSDRDFARYVHARVEVVRS